MENSWWPRSFFSFSRSAVSGTLTLAARQSTHGAPMTRHNWESLTNTKPAVSMHSSKKGSALSWDLSEHLTEWLPPIFTVVLLCNSKSSMTVRCVAVVVHNEAFPPQPDSYFIDWPHDFFLGVGSGGIHHTGFNGAYSQVRVQRTASLMTYFCLSNLLTQFPTCRWETMAFKLIKL